MKSNVLLLMAVVLTSAGAHAAPSCPNGDFAAFVDAFAEDTTLQKAFTAPTLVEQRVNRGRQGPQLAVRKLEPALHPDLAWLSAAQLAARHWVREVQWPDRVYVSDERGLTLKALVFARTECWTLTRVEDWSPAGALRLGIAGPGAQALLRGDAYQAMADGQDPVYPRLFVAALNSYLDAAQQGSTPAAYRAAGLSLSGMAPRLSNARIEQLLEGAVDTYPPAGSFLATFYCDEGEPQPEGTCLHPQKALHALRRWAATGGEAAFKTLGQAYELGAITPAQPARALACYQQAIKQGEEEVTADAQRLVDQGVVVSERQPCL